MNKESSEGGDKPALGNHLSQSAGTIKPAMLSMGAEAGGRFEGRLELRDSSFVNQLAGTNDAPVRFMHLWPDSLAALLQVA